MAETPIAPKPPAAAVAPNQPCAVNFWTFAVPVMLAMTGSHVVGLAAKRIFKNDHAATQDAAMLATKFGAFWLIAGFAWIALCRRNGAQK